MKIELLTKILWKKEKKLRSLTKQKKKHKWIFNLEINATINEKQSALATKRETSIY